MKSMFSRDVAQKPLLEDDIKDFLSDAGFDFVNYTKVESGICLIAAFKRS